MQRALLIVLGWFLIALPLQAAAAGFASPYWEPRAGDRLIVDVTTNTGYLIHEDGGVLLFPVATGRKKHVYYMGRYYNAETPIRYWSAEKLDIQRDRRTFGKSGRFLRLFRDGEGSPYGIHSYFRPEDWMTDGDRYFSLGCIIVTDEIMDVLVKTFELNDNHLAAITTDRGPEVVRQLAERMEKETVN